MKRAALFCHSGLGQTRYEPIAPKVVFSDQTDEKTNFPNATPQSRTNLVATLERLPACCGTFGEPHAVPGGSVLAVLPAAPSGRRIGPAVLTMRVDTAPLQVL